MTNQSEGFWRQSEKRKNDAFSDNDCDGSQISADGDALTSGPH